MMKLCDLSLLVLPFYPGICCFVSLTITRHLSRQFLPFSHSRFYYYAGVKIRLNDTTKSDTQVLADICAWMSLNHKKGRLLPGIIYLHCITDVRIGGSSLEHKEMFPRLCSPNALQSLLLTTTQWSNVDQVLEERRDGELRNSDFWRGLIARVLLLWDLWALGNLDWSYYT